MSDRCKQMSPRPDGSFWVCSLDKGHDGAHDWAWKPSEAWGASYGHQRLSYDTMSAIVEALKASYHISECGEHRRHLMDAERKARKALRLLAGGEE